MTVVNLVNQKHEKVGTIELAEEVFAAPVKKHLLTEIVNWQRASRRAGTHCTLTKADVNGTTKKPFPQKGRGMARQGSLRNPHQIGGGVAFGPKPRDYSYAMPSTKRRAALASAVSLRLQENSLHVLKDFELAAAKTKNAVEVLKALGCEKALVVDVQNDTLKRCMRNLASAKYIDVAGLNVYDVLRFPSLVFTERAAHVFQERVIA